MGAEYAGQVATTDPAGKTVTYSSSDETVATVDESTGAVTLVGAGTTLITAVFAGDTTHNAAQGSYALTVAAAAAEPGQ
ncbi:MAG: Ig-like domain-containing protein [Prevotella sp.]|nr:Ig-like domain-containing protein [Prevotella sp.]